ncbi:MAG: hypothetical protein AAB968_03675 [Patescibacteria group bacterium]
MGIFEKFSGKRKPDSLEDSNKSQSSEEISRGDAFTNQEPQEPILPNGEALEREAGELFVPRQKQPTTASAETKSQARETSYTGNAEIKGLSGQETAMTKARSDVLDLLARIEKAGLPVSEKLRDAVKNELVNLASETARIEFQEAQRADPVVILRNILEEFEKKQTVQALKDGLSTALRDVREQTEEVVRSFQTAKETLIQQGVVDPTDDAILTRIPGFGPRDDKKRILAQVPLYSSTVAVREACAAELLKELGVFAAGASLSLADLFTAIIETRRTTVEQGEPYYDQANVRLVGLTSIRPELKGLSILVDCGNSNNGDISIRLFGDSSFWLRVIQSARILEKNS